MRRSKLEYGTEVKMSEELTEKSYICDRYEKRDYFTQKSDFAVAAHVKHTFYAFSCNLFHLISCFCCREARVWRYNDTQRVTMR